MRKKLIATILAAVMLSVPVQAAVDFTISDNGNLLIQHRAEIKTAVWGEKGGQNDLIWYDTQYSKDGFHTKVDLAKHGEYGRYYCHTYLLATDQKPVMLFADEMFVEEEPTLLVHKDEDTIQIHAYGYPYNEVVAVWSEKNGQDDIEWYWMGKEPVTIKKKHMDGSVMHVHLYGYDANNKPHFLGAEDV